MFDHAYRFVTWDQGISQTWERRHGASPKQALSTCADAAVSDIHHEVVRTRLAQVKLLDRQQSGGVKNDGLGFHVLYFYVDGSLCQLQLTFFLVN
jgi:hypothetical protein